MNIQQQQAALASLPTDQTAIPILQKIAQGQHPMFPPGTEWMGLAKMNEVKRSMEAAQAMQQSAMAAPQGTTTVRDQVQQGVAALAQQQAQQQQMQQAILSGRQPPGVPAMAAGGAVARYAGDEGSLVGDIPGYRRDERLLEYLQQKEQPEEEMRALPAFWEALKQGKTVAEVRRIQGRTPFVNTERERDTLRRMEAGVKEGDKPKSDAWDPSKESVWKGGRVPAGQLRSWAQGGDPEATALLAAYLKKFPDGADALGSSRNQTPPTPAQDNYRSAPAGPSASAPTPMVRTAPGGIATLATKAELPTFVPELPEDPVAARKALVANEPLLQGDQFADRRKYADILAQREQAAAARNAADTPELERAAWTRKLLAAANAAGSQGGLKGIAAALGGFGAQSVKESEADRARREQQITLQQQAEDLRVKYQQETAAAERAVAEGRVAEALKHRENIRALKEAAKKLRYEALLKVYEKDRESEEKALDRQNSLDVQGMANEGYAARSSSSGKTPAELYNMAVDNAQKELGDLAKTPQGMLMKPAELDRLRAERIAYHMRQLGLTPPAGVESASPSKPGGLSPADQALIDKYSTK